MKYFLVFAVLGILAFIFFFPSPKVAQSFSFSGHSSSASAKSAKNTLVTQSSFCVDGRKALILSGNCGGSYSDVHDAAGGGSECIFTEGPAVTCPANSDPVGYKDACTNKMQLLSDETIHSTSACESKFGENPSESSYRIVCCLN